MQLSVSLDVHRNGFTPERMRLRNVLGCERVVTQIQLLRRKSVPLYPAYVLKYYAALFSAASHCNRCDCHVGPNGLVAANFASFWYADANSEAIASGDVHRRRREITFSVAAAESYLLEWVRDEVLKCDLVRLDTYFPPDKRRSVTEKWKKIIKALASTGLIASAQSFTGTTWENFRRLVNFRNGLIHARISRPQTAGLSESQLPFPTIERLQTLVPGWAVGIVTALIGELHMTTRTKEPDWFTRSE